MEEKQHNSNKPESSGLNSLVATGSSVFLSGGCRAEWSTRVLDNGPTLSCRRESCQVGRWPVAGVRLSLLLDTNACSPEINNELSSTWYVLD